MVTCLLACLFEDLCVFRGMRSAGFGGVERDEERRFESYEEEAAVGEALKRG